ncbi:hypothetical protein JCM33374_g2642 [Metschnikowia sp. JCM 33374]|nr:hypothetical protein JCM33374_g2642 [Metschnikowia sp. JCM 33374]
MANTPLLGYVVPGGITKRDEPAPLAFDFTVVKNPSEVSARDLGDHFKNKRNTFSASLANFHDIYYQLDLYLGSDKQMNSVIIDTGSSDLFVPSTSFSPNTSTTSHDTGTSYGARYIDGTIARGEYYLDTLQFDSGVILSNFQFGVNHYSGLGILGLGNRERETVHQKYDNLPWALHNAGVTPKASYSLYLDPDHGAGVVIFGGVDTAKYDGCLTKYPVHTPGQDLTINLESIKVSGKEITINSPYALDSGTSLGYLDQETMAEFDVLFNTTVVNQGGVEYRTTSCDQPSDQYVAFEFGANTISVPYSDMVVDDGDGTCMFGFAYLDGKQILGDVFLRKAYVYFDLSEQTISLAQSAPGNASNIVSV